MNKIIDLASYTANGKVRNLSGEVRGLAARNEFGLDGLDRSSEYVTVRIPNYVYAISTSFFCGMFSDSYKTLGHETFLKKYRFDVTPDQWPQILQGMERCSYDFEPLVS